jgi:hypothetical protein
MPKEIENLAEEIENVLDTNTQMINQLRDQLLNGQNQQESPKKPIEKTKNQNFAYAPLHLAVLVNKIDKVKALIEGGESVNILSDTLNTPLHLAAQNGNFEVANILLEAGGDVSLKNFLGRTALNFALEGGHLKIVESLLEAGAKINQHDVRIINKPSLKQKDAVDLLNDFTPSGTTSPNGKAGSFNSKGISRS